MSSPDLFPGPIGVRAWQCPITSTSSLAARTALYIGVTNDIARHVDEHRQGIGSRFVKKYRITLLVHIEPHEEIALAIQREKTLKEWPRAWKIRLIERGNSEWEDLYDILNG